MVDDDDDVDGGCYLNTKIEGKYHPHSAVAAPFCALLGAFQPDVYIGG